MSDKSCSGAKPRRRGCCLAAGMAAADHDDVVFRPRASLTAAKIGTASDGVEVSRETSLADAEIGENHIKQILDIDLACYAAETAPGEAQILGLQLRQLRFEGALQCIARDLQRLTVASPGQKRRADVV